ncbi:trypsin-like serine peptidase [Streptacidiphilus carbonis]|jgi:V8-like Glu-specific endopeptidase|uniref:trypsin-like serine peptidase n=1 Tax=Streptacidiphilus carbonis TaxID=105422 RepID=UPI0005A944F0|nr:trypsin-like serine protease [Streptacidiphilus carbonis]
MRRTTTAVLAGALLLAASGCSTASAGPGPGSGPGTASDPATAANEGGVSGSPASWSRERLQQALAKHGGTSHPAKATSTNARVGAIFDQDVTGDHFCTASVVDSSGRNLLLTAAHCVHGGKGGSYGNDLVFVPEYRDGSAPQGEWPITKIFVDQSWIDSSDPDMDVAFLTLGAVNGQQIQDVLGGDTLGVNKGFDQVVRITGYPSDASAPISCFNTTSRQSATQMKIACTGFPGGTSGSPWLSAFDPATRTGTVTGIIGGYQQGGDTDDVSYSPYFGDKVQDLYNEAVSQDG